MIDCISTLEGHRGRTVADVKGGDERDCFVPLRELFASCTIICHHVAQRCHIDSIFNSFPGKFHGETSSIVTVIVHTALDPVHGRHYASP